MSDHEKIIALLVRYATGIDSRDWELFRSCFTDDCALDYGDLGSWDDSASVTEFMQRAHSGPSMHRLTNFAITLDGDEASARTYVDAIVQGPGGHSGTHAVGYCDDELVRTADGWRIARRRYTTINLRFLGMLGIIPNRAALRLAAIGARQVRATIAKESQTTSERK
jgi:hypothetical protein